MSTSTRARKNHQVKHDFRPGDIVQVSGVWPNWQQVREMLLAGSAVSPNIYFEPDRLTHAKRDDGQDPSGPPLLVVTSVVPGRPLRCKVIGR